VAPSVLFTCHGCDKPFQKNAYEVKRQRKKGRDYFYCSRSCQIAHGNRLSPRGASNLTPGRDKDEFSPFRYFMKKSRNRKHETNLDLAYLRDLWESQEGRCALSGIKMTLSSGTAEHDARTGDPWKPSLDRIDSAKGYIRGNVRFVVLIANLAKSRFTDEELIEFCRAVATTQG